MSKKLIITEKPSVAQQFARALHVSGKKDGYIENDEWVITWAVGHLITLCDPVSYNSDYKRWDLSLLPIIPEKYKYAVIGASAKQYKIVAEQLTRADVSVIYDAGDSGREGEYIQRLIYNQCGVEGKKKILRIWIDSQTDAEILRGIKDAKDESVYNNLSDAGYARAKSDWLIGINFTRGLTKKFSYELNKRLGITDFKKFAKLNVGRVMTCVLGIVVDRENEINNFVPVDFYRIDAVHNTEKFTSHWKSVEGTPHFGSIDLYSETGFKDKAKAQGFLTELAKDPKVTVTNIENKTEKKNAPLLYSIAELQNDCSAKFKISPDETLNIAQSLYEKKMTTYPRTDARVLSTAISTEIDVNLNGLKNNGVVEADKILSNGWYKTIGKSKYCDDSKITDHYAIIPTGESGRVTGLEKDVYDMIVRRFCSIFYPAAEYAKTSIELTHSSKEKFFASAKKLTSPGYLEVVGIPTSSEDVIPSLSKGQVIDAAFQMVTSTTQPPKRYTSGSMILAMENAGNLIEDEELRAQIKGSGIGTSATRAEVIKKLTTGIGYLALNKKNQVITPTNVGFAVYDIVKANTPKLLSPKMTASWEKGLSEVENGTCTEDKYMQIMNKYVNDTVADIKSKQAEQGEHEKVESKVVGKCPFCGGDLRESEKAFYCANKKDDKEKGCHFLVPKSFIKAGVPQDIFDELLQGKNSEVMELTAAKSGKTYKASIVFDKSGKLSLEFPSEATQLKCPKCGKMMTKGTYSYACKCGMSIWHTVGGKHISEKTMGCLFEEKLLGPFDGFAYKNGDEYSAFLYFDGKTVTTINSTIAGRKLTLDEMSHLLTSGHTDELFGFISKKGKTFSAKLKTEKGKIVFDFGE